MHQVKFYKVLPRKNTERLENTPGMTKQISSEQSGNFIETPEKTHNPEKPL